MIKRHTVTIQKRTSSRGTVGQITTTYSTLKKIKCDIQPTSLSPAMIQVWGLGDQASGACKMFFDNDTDILNLMRVVYGTKTYDIRNINTWSKHSEATLIPVQGV